MFSWKLTIILCECSVLLYTRSLRHHGAFAINTVFTLDHTFKTTFSSTPQSHLFSHTQPSINSAYSFKFSINSSSFVLRQRGHAALLWIVYTMSQSFPLVLINIEQPWNWGEVERWRGGLCVCMGEDCGGADMMRRCRGTLCLRLDKRVDVVSGSVLLVGELQCWLGRSVPMNDKERRYILIRRLGTWRVVLLWGWYDTTYGVAWKGSADEKIMGEGEESVRLRVSFTQSMVAWGYIGMLASAPCLTLTIIDRSLALLSPSITRNWSSSVSIRRFPLNSLTAF